MITFNDGTTEDEVLPGSTPGGTESFGFTNAPAGKSTSSTSLCVFPDSAGISCNTIGIDDVLLYNGVSSGPARSVPEPFEIAMVSLGIVRLSGLAFLARERHASAGAG